MRVPFVVLAFLLLAPAADAVTFGSFGSLVTVSSTDFNPLYGPLPGPAPTVVHLARGTAGLADDPFYVHFGGGTTIGAFDIALTSFDGATKGAFAPLAHQNQAFTADLGPFAANLYYLEADGVMGHTAGDFLVWSPGNAVLDAGDLELATRTAGSVSVTAGTVIGATAPELVEAADNDGVYPDSTALLGPGTFTPRYFDVNVNGALDTPDRAVIAATAFLNAQLTDTVLVSGGGLTFGNRIVPSDADYILSPTPVATAMLGVTQPGAPAATDNLWIHFADPDGANDDVLANDFALKGPSSMGIVTTVATGQGQILTATTPLAAQVFTIDIDLVTGFTGGDPVYVNRPVALGGSSNALMVSALDYRVTSVTVGSTTYAAGSIVAATDLDATTYGASPGNPAGSFWNLRYHDLDLGGGMLLQSLTNGKYKDDGTPGQWDFATDEVYVAAGANIAAGDTRVYAADSGLPLGVLACPGDTACGQPLASGPDLKVSGTDGTWSAGFSEFVYNSKDARVNNEDHRLVAGGGLTVAAVVSTDTDATRLQPEGSEGVFLSYCPTGCPARLVWNDIGVGPTLGTRFGHGPTGFTATDFIPTLNLVPETAANIAIRYNRGEVANVLDDSFYFSQSPAVDTQDPRIVAFSGGSPPGQFVLATDTEEVSTSGTRVVDSVPFFARIGHIEVDNSPGFTPGDAAYLDINGTMGGSATAGTLTLSDIRLSDFPGQAALKAGNFVRAGGVDALAPFINSAWATQPLRGWHLYFYDANGNGFLDAGDVLYAVWGLTPPPATLPVPLNAIYLVGPGGATTSTVPPPTGGGGNPVPPVVTPTPTPTPTPSPSPSPSPSASPSPSPSPSPSAAPEPPADLVAANQALAASLTVTPDGDDNVLEWDPVAGAFAYQVWRATSPFSLLSYQTATASSYRDRDAPDNARYVVTVVLESDSGRVGFLYDINEEPVAGHSGVPAGEAAAEDDGRDTQPIPAPGLALAAAAVGLALLASRRRR